MENIDNYGQPNSDPMSIETQQPSAVVPDATASAQPAPEGQGATVPAASEFDPKQYEGNYKGQKFYPKDKQHLLNLMQQGYSYSQSMEQLKKERAEFDGIRGQYKKYEDLDKRFQADPKLQQTLMRAIQEYQTGMADGDSPQNPEMLQLRQQIDDLNNRQKQLLEADEDRKLQTEIEQLKKDYAHENWDFDDGEGTLAKKILKHAHDNRILSLKSAYRDFMFDNVAKNAQAEALKKAEAAKVAAAQQGKVVSGSGPVPAAVKGGYNPKMSYNELAEQAVKQLG